jgi:ribosome assembly protein YihI (activator of Der GTPase)
MAAKKPSMMKRDRERARDEKAARKREDRSRAKERGADAGPRVATREELDGYGLPREASGDPFEDRNRG